MSDVNEAIDEADSATFRVLDALAGSPAAAQTPDAAAGRWTPPAPRTRVVRITTSPGPEAQWRRFAIVPIQGRTRPGRQQQRVRHDTGPRRSRRRWPRALVPRPSRIRSPFPVLASPAARADLRERPRARRRAPARRRVLHRRRGPLGQGHGRLRERLAQLVPQPLVLQLGLGAARLHLRQPGRLGQGHRARRLALRAHDPGRVRVRRAQHASAPLPPATAGRTAPATSSTTTRTGASRPTAIATRSPCASATRASTSAACSIPSATRCCGTSARARSCGGARRHRAPRRIPLQRRAPERSHRRAGPRPGATSTTLPGA